MVLSLGEPEVLLQQALAFFKKSFRFRSASFSRVALVLKP